MIAPITHPQMRTTETLEGRVILPRLRQTNSHPGWFLGNQAIVRSNLLLLLVGSREGDRTVDATRRQAASQESPAAMEIVQTARASTEYPLLAHGRGGSREPLVLTEYHQPPSLRKMRSSYG